MDEARRRRKAHAAELSADRAMGMAEEDMPHGMASQQGKEVVRIIEHDQVHEVMGDREGRMMHEEIDRPALGPGELGPEPRLALGAIEPGRGRWALQRVEQ